MVMAISLVVQPCDAFVPSSNDHTRRRSTLYSHSEGDKIEKKEQKDHPSSPATFTRRSAFQRTWSALLTTSAGLAFGLSSTPSSASASDGAGEQTKKTILLTGANSGIGLEASKLLAQKGHTVVLACRTLEKAQAAAATIRETVSGGTLIPVACDLASLDSIRDFVDANKSSSFDVVCYNAGVALNTDDPNIQRTKDGFELSVGINHFGHFYLHHLLMKKNGISTSGGRIVVTASSVHDPASPGGAQGKTATLGNLEGLIRDGKNFEMVDGGSYNGDKAYKDSKVRL